MSFREMLEDDIHNVFLNTDEFAEKRIVRYYDGAVYDGPDHDGIPVVLSGQTLSERPRKDSGYMQGIYLVTDVLHCAARDLGGHRPEPEQELEISEPDDAAFFRRYRVVSSSNKFGMLRVELEALDE